MHDEDVQRKVDQLARELDEAAVALVRDYVLLDEAGRARFTGREFELLGGGGDRQEAAHQFTTDDLTALALLGVPVSGAAALELLDDRHARWSNLLSEIDVLEDPSTAAERHQLTDDSSAAHHLWSAVKAVPTMGATRTGKLLARKRPMLLPVYDSVVEAAISPGDAWWRIIAAFWADEGRLDALERVRRGAGATDVLSPLRTLDVVLWMRYRGPIEG